MPVEPWPIVEVSGKSYYEIESLTRIEVDPTGEVFFLVGTPAGGAANVGPLVKGDPGKHTEIDPTIVLTELAADDATSASASFVELVPGNDTTSQVVQLHLALHEGEPGAPGDTIIDPYDFGTPIPGKTLVVDATGYDFEYSSFRIGDRFVPATIANCPSGNPTYTLCSVGIPPQDFDWRPEVSGSCIITGTGADLTVDLIARLNDPVAGNEVGRAFGVAGQYPPQHYLYAGPPPGSAFAYDKVDAHTPATIYLNAERQTGTQTFTTLGSTTRFKVRVAPIP